MPTTAMPNSIILSGLSIARGSETSGPKLREENYAIHPIEELENSDLFKFSPFKTLTPDQYETIETIFKRLEQEHEDVKHGRLKKRTYNRREWRAGNR